MSLFAITFLLLGFFLPYWMTKKNLSLTLIKRYFRICLSDGFLHCLLCDKTLFFSDEILSTWKAYLVIRFLLLFYVLSLNVPTLSYFQNFVRRLAVIVWSVGEQYYFYPNHYEYTLFLICFLLTLEWAMFKNRFPFLRACVHASISYFIWGVGIPSLIFNQYENGFSFEMFFKLPIFFYLSMASSLLVLLLALFAFSLHEGTPDPCDPPGSLVNDGIYAWLRHPLHLAHSLWVFTWVLFWLGEAKNGEVKMLLWIYAFSFLVFHLFFLKKWEETFLMLRYGEEAKKYFQEVSAYGFTRSRVPCSTLKAIS